MFLCDDNFTVARKRVCPEHKGERLLPSEESVEKFQIDLRLTKKGCEKIVTKYTGQNAFCPRCSTQLHLSCSHCQNEVHAGDVYCPYCGKVLETSSVAR